MMVHFWGRLWYNMGVESLFARWYTFGAEAKKLRAKQMTTWYPYDNLASYPGKPFKMPYQRAELVKKFWPVRVAARKWGCSYRAARLYMTRHPDICVLVRILSPSATKPRWILTVKPGTPKTPAMRGNPDLMNPEWQRRMAMRRWRARR